MLISFVFVFCCFLCFIYVVNVPVSIFVLNQLMKCRASVRWSGVMVTLSDGILLYFVIHCLAAVIIGITRKCIQINLGYSCARDPRIGSISIHSLVRSLEVSIGCTRIYMHCMNIPLAIYFIFVWAKRSPFFAISNFTINDFTRDFFWCCVSCFVYVCVCACARKYSVFQIIQIQQVFQLSK